MLPINPNPRTGFIIAEQHIREMQAAADMAALAQEATNAPPSAIQQFVERLAALNQKIDIPLDDVFLRMLIILFPDPDKAQSDELP
jgi:hypothetical protein